MLEECKNITSPFQNERRNLYIPAGSEVESLYNRVLTWHSDVTGRAWVASLPETSVNSGRQPTDTGRERLIARRNCLSQLHYPNWIIEA